jgi:Ca2+-binding EF-hand superfamily protein
LNGDDEDFKPYYVEFVVARFQFYLLPSLSTNFSVEELVVSKCFLDFVRLDAIGDKSPFSLQSAVPVYDGYCTLDRNNNTLLDPADLEWFSVGGLEMHLSSAFRGRLFDTMQPFDGRLDFSQFLRLYFSLNFPHLPLAAEFFMGIFDLDGDGIVGRSDIEYFHKSIMNESDGHGPSFDRYLAEIFDLCGSGSDGFGVCEFLECGDCRTLIQILVDLDSFAEETSE